MTSNTLPADYKPWETISILNKQKRQRQQKHADYKKPKLTFASPYPPMKWFLKHFRANIVHRNQISKEDSKRIVNMIASTQRAKGVVIGINDVARALENQPQNLLLVIVASGVHKPVPELLVKHVREMACLAQVPLCNLQCEVAELGKAIRVSNCTAIAIVKSCDEVWKKVVDEVYNVLDKSGGRVQKLPWQDLAKNLVYKPLRTINVYPNPKREAKRQEAKKKKKSEQEKKKPQQSVTKKGADKQALNKKRKKSPQVDAKQKKKMKKK